MSGSIWFPSPYGDLFVSIFFDVNEWQQLYNGFPSPYGDLFVSIGIELRDQLEGGSVSVPLRGFICFYGFFWGWICPASKFPSPYGDLFVSIMKLQLKDSPLQGFRPLTGIYLFLFIWIRKPGWIYCFRPLTGIYLFLSGLKIFKRVLSPVFPSPYGDLFVSILYEICKDCFQDLFPSPYGDLFVSMQ